MGLIIGLAQMRTDLATICAEPVIMAPVPQVAARS
jgi:hypothetical protein